MSNLRASVIVPTYNKARYLDLTLASFCSQDVTHFDVVVVDDGSPDDGATKAVVAKYKSKFDIKYVRQDNKGRSAARNTAIRAATGDILILSDDDRIVTPGFVRAHLSRFESPTDRRQVLGWQHGILTRWIRSMQTQPQIAQLALQRPELISRVRGEDDAWLVSPEDVELRLAATCETYRLSEPWWDQVCLPCIRALDVPLSEFRLAWALGTSGNMSATRESLLAIGGFDEGFRGWGMEDHDLCYRLWQAGCAVEDCEGALSYHQVHTSVPAKLAEWIVNFNHFAAKHDSIDVYLFSQVFRGVDPVKLNALSRQCDELIRSGQGAIVAELKRVYAVVDSISQTVRRQ